MSRVREQLRNQDLDTVIIDAFKQVGGVVFPDKAGVMDLNALISIVDSWRSVHVATFGNILPNSGVLAENIADGGGLEPQDNEVIHIQGISFANGGGAPVEVQMRIGDLPMIALAVPPNGVSTSSEIMPARQLILSKGNALKFVVTSGTASDFSAKIAYNYSSK
jgi:hypothetical protein